MSERPLLLDLFSGAGGCSRGYFDAGFQPVGVDIRSMRRYPYAFVCADALVVLRRLLGGDQICASDGQAYRLRDFVAIHASPPCQAYCALKHLTTRKHPELIEPTRTLLQATGLPYIIENVVGAPLLNPLLLCGSMFGLETSCGAQLRRHRLFESNYLLMSPGHCQHGKRPLAVNGHEFRNEATRWQERRTIMVCGDTPRDPAAERRKYRTINIVGKVSDCRRVISVTGSTPQQNVVRNQIRETFPIEEARRAMGIEWMTMGELSQAIPPAYTLWIGHQLLIHIGGFSK